MWPSAISELKKGEMKARDASLVTVACFVLGYVGMQVISRVLHSYMPTHVVDCDHTHDEVAQPEHSELPSRSTSMASYKHDGHGRMSRSLGPKENGNGLRSETTPLLSHDLRTRSISARTEHDQHLQHSSHSHIGSRKEASRRPSMMQLVPTRVLSFIKDSPRACDEDVACKGYTDPCGQECFRHLEGKGRTRSSSRSRRPTVYRSATLRTQPSLTPIIPVVEEDEESPRTTRRQSYDCPPPPHDHGHGFDDGHGHHGHQHDEEAYDVESNAEHHHHVPQNAFMSVGLQTSIAIGLHKLPEGFIMFATNHANPALGFNVFFALFIHNITEGFAMVLPLYLALQSRTKAMAFACFLGGFSQPLGAGIAALWFHVAGSTDHDPSHIVYGCLFGTVSGIMAAVALLLLLEGIAVYHNSAWCSAFVLVGFVIFGVSTSLTA